MIFKTNKFPNKKLLFILHEWLLQPWYKDVVELKQILDINIKEVTIFDARIHTWCIYV